MYILVAIAVDPPIGDAGRRSLENRWICINCYIYLFCDLSVGLLIHLSGRKGPTASRKDQISVVNILTPSGAHSRHRHTYVVHMVANLRMYWV